MYVYNLMEQIISYTTYHNKAKQNTTYLRKNRDIKTVKLINIYISQKTTEI